MHAAVWAAVRNTHAPEGSAAANCCGDALRTPLRQSGSAATAVSWPVLGVYSRRVGLPLSLSTNRRSTLRAPGTLHMAVMVAWTGSRGVSGRNSPCETSNRRMCVSVASASCVAGESGTNLPVALCV